MNPPRVADPARERKGIRPLDEVQTHRMWMLLCLESWMRQLEERHDIRLELA